MARETPQQRAALDQAEAEVVRLRASPDYAVADRLAKAMHARARAMDGAVAVAWNEVDDAWRLFAWDAMREGRKIAAERRAG